ncbi:MAG: HD domain-containing protein [Pseudomonadales bacterium]
MNKNTDAFLVTDPGRPSKPVLAKRFISTELKFGFGRLSRALGFQALNDALPADWAIPDSELAVQAIETANALCPEFMIRHCFRSYCFGAILAARNGLNLDRETLFVAAMLHDLGVSETHANDPGSFEWVGARLAHEFCLSNEQSDARAATVHNSIALHTSLGVADKFKPEIAMLHFGTAMDLFGMRLDEIPRETLDLVLSGYPRGAFKTEFSPCLAHQAESKPDSQIAGAVGIGILDRVQEKL